MDTVRGYSIKGRKGLSHWDSLLEEWLLAVERYCRVMKGEDSPYYYNERANISVLNGAAWRSGRIALEEFQSEKGYEGDPAKYGRTDLWLADTNGEETIEAKFKWICMDSNDIHERVDRTMEAAVDDAIRSCPEIGFRSIGLGFFPVYKNQSRVDDIDALIAETVETFSGLEYHALAWCFPKEMRNHISEKGNFVPGVFLLAKNIDY